MMSTMDSYDIIGYHKCSVILLKYISSTCSSYSAKYTSKDQDQGSFWDFHSARHAKVLQQSLIITTIVSMNQERQATNNRQVRLLCLCNRGTARRPPSSRQAGVWNCHEKHHQEHWTPSLMLKLSLSTIRIQFTFSGDRWAGWQGTWPLQGM